MNDPDPDSDPDPVGKETCFRILIHSRIRKNRV
jgi:hypothetical protein